jgi:hypothetical protein
VRQSLFRDLEVSNTFYDIDIGRRGYCFLVHNKLCSKTFNDTLIIIVESKAINLCEQLFYSKISSII